MSPESSGRIAPVRDPRDLEAVRELFREYAEGLAFDLAYQGFARELIQLRAAMHPRPASC